MEPTQRGRNRKGAGGYVKAKKARHETESQPVSYDKSLSPFHLKLERHLLKKTRKPGRSHSRIRHQTPGNMKNSNTGQVLLNLQRC